MNLPPLEGMGHWTAKVKKRKEKAKKKTVKSKKIDTK
jgi:hypothetical protein